MKFIKCNRITLTLILLAAVMIVFGVWQGEAETVLRKAINICMECIGLG